MTAPWRWARLRAWWDARHPPSDTLALTQRNVYILPTRGGWLWALLVLTLLVGAINYQLNLGYLLCFVLAGVALVSMHSCHATLRGLQLQLTAPEPVHAGQNTDLVVSLIAQRGSSGARYGIGIRLTANDAAGSISQPAAPTPGRASSRAKAPPARPAGEPAVPWATDASAGAWTWLDIAAARSAGRVGAGAGTGTGEPPATVVHLALPCPRRGWHDLPRLQLETRFPFGLFRAWTVWRPASRVLVWPAPETPPPPWPLEARDPAKPPERDCPSARLSTNPLDADSARPYRSGDTPREILWKKSASSIASGANPALVSRTGSAAAPQASLDFEWQDAAPGGRSGGNLGARVGTGNTGGGATRKGSERNHASTIDPTGHIPSRLDADVEARLSRLTAWVLAADRADLAWTLRLPARVLARNSGPAHRRACLDALAQFDLSSTGGVVPTGLTHVQAGSTDFTGARSVADAQEVRP
ncbi:MAG: hypothetical protein RL375_4747 [Pseudomonadota bacterium]